MSLSRCIAAAMLAASLARLASAQEGEPPAGDAPSDGAVEIIEEDDGMAAALAGDDVDPRAIAAWLMALEGRYIDARERAEEVLREQPDSYAAHLVLGHVLHVGEGDLPRARYHLLKAERLFEERYGVPAPDASPWRWHLITLDKLASVSGEMDRFDDRIDYLRIRDGLYSAQSPGEYGWAYMRLGRYEEARRSVDEAMAMEDERQAAVARTALCALEFELRHREAAYEACTEAARLERDADGFPAPFANAGSASLGVLKADEAERWFLECGDEFVPHFDPDSPTNPWIPLTDMYVGQGRPAEARDALFEALRWRGKQAPNLDEQTWAEMQIVSSLFLLAVGRPEDAARLSSRTLARPDRTGFVSSDPERILAGAAILDSVAHRVAAERAAEAASFSRPWERLRLGARVLALGIQAHLSARRAGAVVAGDDVVVASMRPYVGGGILLPVWLSPELVRALGAGVTGEAIGLARAEETLPEATPYLDALEAESAYIRGDAAAARALAEGALQVLPGAELMLAARLHALAGLAAEDAGDVAGALEHWDQAVQRDPGVVRLLGIRLPCRMEVSGGGIAERAARLLARSPRLRNAGEGFGLRVEGEGSEVRACLAGIAGRVIACAEITAKGGESDADAARRLAEEFHAQAFAPRVELTQADLKSLDGGTTSAGMRKMEGLLEVIEGKATTR